MEKCFSSSRHGPRNHSARTRNRECLEQCWIKHCHTTAYSKSVYFGKIANEDFCPSPPYQINFAKNRKNSESTQNGLKRREIEKKIFAPWWPPPEKNLEKFSKIFLKIFWKLFRIIWNVKKTRKIFFHFFSVIPKKNLEKFSNFFFENFSKVVQNHLKREKNSKKNFSFFPYFGLG